MDSWCQVSRRHFSSNVAALKTVVSRTSLRENSSKTANKSVKIEEKGGKGIKQEEEETETEKRSEVGERRAEGGGPIGDGAKG